MDISIAIKAHSNWLINLVEYLCKRDGSLKPEEVEVDNKCLLGQWIYNEGLRLQRFPEDSPMRRAYNKLRFTHAELHKVVARLITYINANQPVPQSVIQELHMHWEQLLNNLFRLSTY